MDKGIGPSSMSSKQRSAINVRCGDSILCGYSMDYLNKKLPTLESKRRFQKLVLHVESRFRRWGDSMRAKEVVPDVHFKLPKKRSLPLNNTALNNNNSQNDSGTVMNVPLIENNLSSKKSNILNKNAPVVSNSLFINNNNSKPNNITVNDNVSKQNEAFVPLVDMSSLLPLNPQSATSTNHTIPNISNAKPSTTTVVDSDLIRPKSNFSITEDVIAAVDEDRQLRRNEDTDGDDEGALSDGDEKSLLSINSNSSTSWEVVDNCQFDTFVATADTPVDLEAVSLNSNGRVAWNAFHSKSLTRVAVQCRCVCTNIMPPLPMYIKARHFQCTRCDTVTCGSCIPLITSDPFCLPLSFRLCLGCQAQLVEPYATTKNILACQVIQATPEGSLQPARLSCTLPKNLTNSSKLLTLELRCVKVSDPWTPSNLPYHQWPVSFRARVEGGTNNGMPLPLHDSSRRGGGGFQQDGRIVPIPETTRRKDLPFNLEKFLHTATNNNNVLSILISDVSSGQHPTGYYMFFLAVVQRVNFADPFVLRTSLHKAALPILHCRAELTRKAFASIEQQKKEKQMDKEKGKEVDIIKTNFGDDEIILYDRAGRFSLPGRSSKCTHSQVFDVLQFVQAQCGLRYDSLANLKYSKPGNSRRMCCPIPFCGQRIFLEDLQVDSFLWSIINQTTRLTKVKIDGKGSFKVYQAALTTTASNKVNSNSAADEKSTLIARFEAGENLTPTEMNKVIAFLNEDDDDDDAKAASPASKPPTAPTTATMATTTLNKETENKAKNTSKSTHGVVAAPSMSLNNNNNNMNNKNNNSNYNMNNNNNSNYNMNNNNYKNKNQNNNFNNSPAKNKLNKNNNPYQNNANQSMVSEANFYKHPLLHGVVPPALANTVNNASKSNNTPIDKKDLLRKQQQKAIRRAMEQKISEKRKEINGAVFDIDD